MKFIAKFLLTVISVLVFILLMLSINIRFQFMSSKFWTDTFAKGNVYSKISTVITSELESKVSDEGGKESDITILTDIISPLNVKAFFEENLRSILSYADGKTTVIEVYAPPLVPTSKEITLEKMSLSDFLSEYNISGFDQNTLQQIAKFGIRSWLLFGASLAVFLLIMAFMYLLAAPGSRLGGMGLVLILSGALAAAFYFVLNYSAALLVNNFTGSANIGTAMGVVAAPPVILEAGRIWGIGGVLALTAGIVLFFIKKPAKTNWK